MTPISEDGREKLRLARLGTHLSPETKEKLSKGRKGKPMSEEAKRKLSESKKRGYAEGRTKIAWKGTKGIVTWAPKGKDNWNWKGGRRICKSGYVWILQRDHPNANSSGCVAEHRLVMSNYLQRPLCPWEKVHHKNGRRSDNRLENLLLVLSGSHNGKVKCPKCRYEFGIK